MRHCLIWTRDGDQALESIEDQAVAEGAGVTMAVCTEDEFVMSRVRLQAGVSMAQVLRG
jgi:rRNA-processing protein FCF1